MELIRLRVAFRWLFLHQNIHDLLRYEVVCVQAIQVYE